MPGNVSTVAPSVVMPAFLCSEYQDDREYTLRINEYPDGSSDRSTQFAVSRKRWTLTAHAGDSLLNTLWAFALARRGGPFWFYCLAETTPLFTVDMSGANSNGRYKVRFEGDLNLASKIGARWLFSFALVEVQ